MNFFYCLDRRLNCCLPLPHLFFNDEFSSFKNSDDDNNLKNKTVDESLASPSDISINIRTQDSKGKGLTKSFNLGPLAVVVCIFKRTTSHLLHAAFFYSITKFKVHHIFLFVGCMLFNYHAQGNVSKNRVPWRGLRHIPKYATYSVSRFDDVKVEAT